MKYRCTEVLLLGLCLWLDFFCPPATARVQVRGRAFWEGGQRFWLLGVNYYPQASPWSLFWQQSDPSILQADLAKIHALGFNTVRIFVPYVLFSGPDAAVYHQKLKHFLDWAAAEQLYCIVTLFDFYTDYDRIEVAQQALRQLVKGLETHPAVLAWDLKNEGDLDYGKHPERVIRWIKAMAQTLREIPVQQLITAGWSRPETAPDIAPYLDYVTFHYYGPEAQLPALVAYLQGQSVKPLVLGEFGYHTWRQSPHDPHLAAQQFNYYQCVMFSVLKQDLAGALAWTLYDFKPQLREPWVLSTQSEQHYLGLLDQDQKPKAGLKALQQGVYLRDAQSLKAVSLDSREIEMVFRAAHAGQAQLVLKSAASKRILQTWSVHQGLNTFRWSVNAPEIHSLLSLQSQYVLDCPVVLGPAGKPLLSQHLPLVLRQD